MTGKTVFYNNEELSTRRLRCWKCQELLTPVDIETYLVCPYCNAQLERCADTEDFAIEPLVQQWISRYPAMQPDNRGRA